MQYKLFSQLHVTGYNLKRMNRKPNTHIFNICIMNITHAQNVPCYSIKTYM